MAQWSQLGDFDYHFPSVSAQQLLVEISGMAYRDLLTAQSCYSRCQAGADVDAKHNVDLLYDEIKRIENANLDHVSPGQDENRRKR
ncbi:hypothetical protein AOLI_G00049260 [Acnodon oligacanthus]